MCRLFPVPIGWIEIAFRLFQLFLVVVFCVCVFVCEKLNLYHINLFSHVFFIRQFLKSKSTRTQQKKTETCFVSLCDGGRNIKSKNRIKCCDAFETRERIDTKAKNGEFNVAFRLKMVIWVLCKNGYDFWWLISLRSPLFPVSVCVLQNEKNSIWIN